MDDARSRPSSRWTRPTLALALVGVAAAAWWVADDSSEPGGVAAPATGSAIETDDADDSLRAPPRDDPATAGGTRAPQAAGKRGGSGAVPEPVRAPEAARVDLLLRFVDPRRDELLLTEAVLELRGDNGTRRAMRVHDDKQAWIKGLPLGAYSLSVVAAGFTHRGQVLDLGSLEGDSPSRSSGAGPRPGFDERVILWPAGWVAVVVRTADDRPLAALADELGLEPRRLFVGAFEARARVDPPGPEAWEAVVDPPVAVFHLPPTHQAWQLPGSSVGSLQLLGQPPLWVGLAIHGVPIGWELLPPGASEVVFRIDASAFERRFARLTLRVVDPAGVPRDDAVVTLRADTSAHRREEHSKVSSDADGRVAFERVLPGRHELLVQAGQNLHQQILELRPGEERDLGQVVLDATPGVAIRVVDAGGRPVRAWVEIAPYQPGEHVDAVYPPSLHRLSDEGGLYRLPLPSSLSVVRATLALPPRMMATDDRSTNVLLDPHAPPLETLVLTVHDPTEVVFEVPALEGLVLEVLDVLDLGVARVRERSPGRLRTELVPGTYRARLRDAAGEVLGEASFFVGDEPLLLSLP